MAARDVAAAWQRAESALRRRPEMGLHDDAPATACWRGDTQTIACHANGTQVVTDMPRELGGSGEHVTPGWLLRAGLAACTATRVAMAAAAQGIELQTLEVFTGSRSDSRGLLGMLDASGKPVYAGPREMHMRVRIAAAGVPAQRLRELVEESYRHSPMSCAIQDPLPVALRIEVDGA
jgi:uncharacterized OsmC-like protein